MSINLNSAQTQAVRYLEGPLLVLAGPGTGKTQLLSSKVAYILESTDANPENILCLTFTDAGAVNMRNRLLSVIGRAAARVNIHTYHSFGSDLLARYRHYAEHLDRIFDAPIDNVTKFKIIQSIRETLPPFDILKSSITPTSDVIDIIDAAKSHRLTAADLAAIATANLASAEILNQALSPLLESAPRGARYPKAVETVYQPLLEILAAHTSAEPILKNIEPEANVLVRSLHDALLEVENDPKHSVKPLGAWRDQTFEKDDQGHFRLKNLIANKKLASIARIMAEYDARLRADNLFDFNDMIEETINILKTDAGFRLDLSERFQYVLLDEFQDTNPSQFELVRLLTDYEKPCIMAVGDDDQAIYAFQGANASNLIDFQNIYDAQVINLTENYRSTAEILTLSKQISAQITDSFAKKQSINKALTSVRNTDLLASVPPQIQEILTPIPPLYHTSVKKSSISGENCSATPAPAPVAPTSNGPVAKSEPQPSAPTLISRHEFISPDAEYYWVAQEIKTLISRGVNPSDIAVLAPRHALILPIIPYLKAENIDLTYEKRENLLEDPQIKPLLTLAEFIYDLAEGKNPSHRLLEILAFPFWGVPALSVITALQQAKSTPDQPLKTTSKSQNSAPGQPQNFPSPQSPKNLSTLDHLTHSSDPALQNLAKFLADLVAASFEAPLELFLDYLIGTAELNGFRSPYLDYYTGSASVQNSASAPTPTHNQTSKIASIQPNQTSTSTQAPTLDQNSAPAQSPKTTPNQNSAQNPETSTAQTFTLYNHLSVLRETLRPRATNLKITLKDLISLLQDYRAAGEAVLSTSPYQDSARSVQVMTAHKSKGLEFKHVFLISLNDKAWGNASGNRNLTVLPKNLTHLRHTGDTENECLRLLFVALTRAEVSLTLTNSVKSFSDSNLPRLQYLDEHEDANHRPVSPYLPRPEIQVHYDNLDQARRQTNLTTHWISAYREPLPALRPILQKNLEHYRLTASDLTSFIDLRYAGPANFYQTRILGAPREPLSRDIVLGNLMHATFEAVTTNGISDQAALDFFQEKLTTEPLTAADLEFLREKGIKSLEISLAKFGDLLRSPTAKAEVDLRHESLILPNHLASLKNSTQPETSAPANANYKNPSVAANPTPAAPTSDVPLTGKIDHLAIDPAAKTIEIYDFKTGTFHPKDWTTHDSLYRYSLQLGFYKLLLNLSPTYQNYTVTRGHILYVTPDSSGAVYDKVYDYPEKDEVFLKNLISAVFHQVKTLDFVDNPALFLTADANRSVSDVRRFAELVIAETENSGEEESNDTF